MFSLGEWAPQLPTGLACPVVLRNSAEEQVVFAYRTGTVCGGLFNTLRLTTRFSHMPVLQPRSGKPDRFGLFRVRSPLLAEWFLFLWVLRCFSSPGSLPLAYVFNQRMTAETCVPPPGFPIRTSPDRSLHTAPRGLSQCSASFIGTWRQGIHRTPLVAYARDAENSAFFFALFGC